MQNGHLYGVEDVHPKKDIPTGYHHHRGSIKSHGWYEALSTIREVGMGLSATAPRGEDKDGKLVSDVKIGVFASYQDMSIFPYSKRGEAKSGTADDEDAEMSVAISSDVTDDPFCPLPLYLWTHNIGHGPNS